MLTKKIALIMILIVVAVGGSTVFLMCRGPDGDRKMRGMQGQGSEHRMQIGGLRFFGMHQGKKVISIRADRFTIQKGKFGFFRTGLTQEAKIENAHIDLYASSSHAREDRRVEPSAGSPGRSAGPQWDFGDLFSGEALASLLPTKSITAIEAAPVTVVLHGDSSVLTRISAAGASVRLRKQDILFKGGVRVSSGEAELTTDQLIFVPRTSRLKADDVFALKRGPRTIQGTSLTTDLFLQPF